MGMVCAHTLVTHVEARMSGALSPCSFETRFPTEPGSEQTRAVLLFPQCQSYRTVWDHAQLFMWVVEI